MVDQTEVQEVKKMTISQYVTWLEFHERRRSEEWYVRRGIPLPILWNRDDPRYGSIADKNLKGDENMYVSTRLVDLIESSEYDMIISPTNNTRKAKRKRRNYMYPDMVCGTKVIWVTSDEKNIVNSQEKEEKERKN